MLFRLPRDCSASGMFAVHNVMSCPALVRKLVYGFYKRVKASQNKIVLFRPSVDLTSGGSLQLEQTGINCYISTTLLYFHNAGHTSYLLYVVFAFFYYAVTYNYVLWAEGVSEINY